MNSPVPLVEFHGRSSHSPQVTIQPEKQSWAHFACLSKRAPLCCALPACLTILYIYFRIGRGRVKIALKLLYIFLMIFIPDTASKMKTKQKISWLFIVKNFCGIQVSTILSYSCSYLLVHWLCSNSTSWFLSWRFLKSSSTVCLNI